MILVTALKHFDEDISRASALLTHADTQPEGLLKSDIIRSGWMLAVGALDAYFCDAYGDLIARTLRAKKLEPAISIPDKLKSIKIPAIVVIENHINDGWLWRMIARDLIEKDNVLSIAKIKELFNHFLRSNRKLFVADADTLGDWITHRDSRHRLFGTTSTNYRATATGRPKAELKKACLAHLEERFKMIFQRRHDCIHNCDRPKIAVQINHISVSYTRKVVDDIVFIVNRCNEEFRSEFPHYLTNLGFSATTRNALKV